MKKRIICIIMAGAVAMSAAACGSGAKDAASAETGQQDAAAEDAAAEDAGSAASPEAMESVEASESEAGESVGMANPWRDITEEEAIEMIPNLFKIPEGATNVRWSVMGEYDPQSRTLPGPLVQADYDLEGLSFTERAQVTGDTVSDISGMYYDWTVSDDVTLAGWGGGNMKGKAYRYLGDDETADLITWYDVEIGISYSLSTSAPDLDGFDIQAVAEASYDETKVFGYNAPE